jgi:hypothetical protein
LQYNSGVAVEHIEQYKNRTEKMEIKDVLGLGKVLPLEKLVDVVSKAVGRHRKSYYDRKDIDTEAYRIKALAEAKAEGIKVLANAIKDNFENTGKIEYIDQGITISSPQQVSPAQPPQPPVLISLPVEEQAQQRINYQEAKRQLNVQSVTSFAAEELKHEEAVTDEPVDEDWTNRFFRYAEDISNEEMQALWGRILAGEVKHPKTYSVRTLDLLRNLSKEEAAVFLKVAPLRISSGTNCYIFRNASGDPLLDYGLPYDELSLLVEIGLIQPGENIVMNLQNKPDKSQVYFTSGDTIILLDKEANSPNVHVPIYKFTRAGRELLNLINTNPPFEYLTAFAKSMRSEHISVTYSKIVQVLPDGRVTYSTPFYISPTKHLGGKHRSVVICSLF